ncbi:MAG: 1-deoxy-D-xylulose-5-phosphate synthase [Solobacterium sp.]|nr:1-deoxy-D-xylulose-5-phosphate synthase [Solobacterium sp.]
MDLTEIQNPEFLKGKSVSELTLLAYDIRQFLIHNIAKTGGHLASNLGVVELTIALHYVFDSPTDKIFFDVGHQSYTHKILTGRAKDFSTLRQYGGISGFQKRHESIHDVWEAGHSSTALSAALGMTVARDLNNESYEVIPVIGDGAMSSGESLEAMNQIGSEKRRMVIIFNDNNMSISNNVGALTRGFARLRSATTYNNIKLSMKHSLNKSDFGRVIYHGMKDMKDAFKESVIDRGVFGEFNLEYLGPVDGHNLRDLIRVLEVAKTHDGPVVVHVITQKGRGYAPCEKDRSGIWHGVGPFDADTGKPLHETPLGYKSWSRLIADTVEQIAEDDKRIVALTPAMMYGSALSRFFAKYPDRSFDCGIAEEHTVTFAASMANSGLRPFVSIYSSFLQRAYDQINHDVCRMDLPVLFGIDRAGLVGADGETHHGVFDIGFLRPLPNIVIAQPKDAEEARNMVWTAFHQDHPFAIRYPRGEVKFSGSASFEEIPYTWTIVHEPIQPKLIVLAYGPDVDVIKNKLEVNELPVMLINCRFFKPLDEAMIERISGMDLPVYVYETDMKAAGLASAILEYVNDHHLGLELKRYGIGDEFVPQGSASLLKKDEGCDLSTLYEDIVQACEPII